MKCCQAIDTGVSVRKRRTKCRPWTVKRAFVCLALLSTLGVAPVEAGFVDLMAVKIGDTLSGFVSSRLGSLLDFYLPASFRNSLLSLASSRLADLGDIYRGNAAGKDDGYYKYDFQQVSDHGHGHGVGKRPSDGHDAGYEGKFLSNEYFSLHGGSQVALEDEENYISEANEPRTFTPWLFGGSVCYDYYGCFSSSSPWFDPPQRIVNLPPRAPEEVQPKFYLYTRDNQGTRQEIWSDVKIVTDSNFRNTRTTKFIIFGQGDFAEAPWIVSMKDAFLQKENANVIIVDWHPAYLQLQARSDARLAGAMTAMFLKFLQEKFTLALTNVHVIGQGLGAHMGSYACHSLKPDAPFSDPVIGRLTALDPLDVGFTGTDPLVRVDPSDAKFVDVIHTDVHKGKEGIGTSQNMGHVDFFPNGGSTPQPGCDLKIWDAWGQAGGSITEALRKYFYCSHFRAADYFTESINMATTAPATTCQFRSVSCDTWDSFISGTCGLACPADGTSNARCIRMGYNAQTDFLPAVHNGVAFYLRTKSAKAFCQFQYYVNVHIGSLLRNKRGFSWDHLLENIQQNSTTDLAVEERDSTGRLLLKGVFSKGIVGDMYIAFRDSQGRFLGSTFRMNGKPLRVQYGSRVTGVITQDAQLPVQAANANQLDGEVHMTFVPHFDFNQEMLVPDITLTSVETSKSFKMCSDGVIGGRKWQVIPIVFKPC